MALPTSGPLSISAIRTELGSTSGSLRTLSAAAGKSTPDSISEFYGYSAFTPPYISVTDGAVSASGAGTAANPYYIEFQTDYMTDLSEPGIYYWYMGGVSFQASSAGTYNMVYDWDLTSWTDFNGSNLSAQTASPGGNYEEVYRNGTSSADALVALPARTLTATLANGAFIGVDVRFVQDYYPFFVYARLKVYFY